MMHQIYNADAAAAGWACATACPPALDAIVQRALAKSRDDRQADWDEFAQALSALVARPRGAARPAAGRCSTPSASTCCARSSSSPASATSSCGRWCTARSGSATRFGHALYRKGEKGGSFHIIAQGEVEVFRDGQQGGAARRGHLGGRDGLPGAQPRPARATAPTWWCRSRHHDLVHARDDGAASAPTTRHLFDAAFIRVLVRRLHAAHEALAPPAAHPVAAVPSRPTRALALVRCNAPRCRGPAHRQQGTTSIKCDAAISRLRAPPPRSRQAGRDRPRRRAASPDAARRARRRDHHHQPQAPAWPTTAAERRTRPRP